MPRKKSEGKPLPKQHSGHRILWDGCDIAEEDVDSQRRKESERALQTIEKLENNIELARGGDDQAAVRLLELFVWLDRYDLELPVPLRGYLAGSFSRIVFWGETAQRALNLQGDLPRRPGRRWKLQQSRRYRDLQISRWIKTETEQEDGVTKEEAVRSLADSTGLSKSTIWRACKKFKDPCH